MPPAERFNTVESHPASSPSPPLPANQQRLALRPAHDHTECVLHQHRPDRRLLPRAVLQLANRRHRLGLLGNRLRPVPRHRLRGVFHSPPIREIINAKAREATRPTRFSFPLLLYVCRLAPLCQKPLAVALCALRAPQSANEPPSPLLGVAGLALKRKCS